MRVENWAKDVAFEPTEWATPTTVEEVRALVQRARREGKTIRTVGRLHSSTEIIVANEICLSTERLDRILEIDEAAGRVVVEPGVTLRALVTALEARGLALENTGGVLQQSIAGALTCDTHGTGRQHPPLNSMVTGYTFVDGRGREVRATPEDDVFWALGVSLGMLGVITRIELRCVPQFFLRNEVTVLDFEHLQDVVAESERYPRLQYFWYPDEGKVVRNTLTPAEDPGPAEINKAIRLRNTFDYVFTGVNHFMGAVVSSRRFFVRRLLSVFDASKGMTLPSHAALSFRHFPKMHEAEVAFDIADAPAVLQYLGENIATLTRTKKVSGGIRFCAASRCYLSPVHGRDSLYVTLISVSAKDFDRVIDFQVELARRFGGRFHWGKKHPKDPQLIRDTYQELPRFLSLVGEHDPDRLFSSPYFDEVFPDRVPAV